MATVGLFNYGVFFELRPGQEAVTTIGPYNWSKQALSATATGGFETISGGVSMLSVTEIQKVAQLGGPNVYEEFVNIRVKNTGMQTVPSYELSFGAIAP